MQPVPGRRALRRHQEPDLVVVVEGADRQSGLRSQLPDFSTAAALCRGVYSLALRQVQDPWIGSLNWLAQIEKTRNTGLRSYVPQSVTASPYSGVKLSPDAINPERSLEQSSLCRTIDFSLG